MSERNWTAWRDLAVEIRQITTIVDNIQQQLQPAISLTTSPTSHPSPVLPYLQNNLKSQTIHPLARTHAYIW